MTSTTHTPMTQPRAALPGPQATESQSSAVSYARHVLVIAKRSLIKTWRTPEALIDVTVQPVIFLAMFTYIFGGAIADGTHEDTWSSCSRASSVSPSQSPASPWAQPERRHREGHLRPVPVVADRALGPAGRGRAADLARYLTLCVITLGSGDVMGFRVETGRSRTLAAIGCPSRSRSASVGSRCSSA